MAKLYNQDSFTPSSLISLGATFARQNGQPLAEDEVWTDLEALKAFAKTDTAYVGQIFSYVDQTAGTVINYTVLPSGDLQEVGGAGGAAVSAALESSIESIATEIEANPDKRWIITFTKDAATGKYLPQFSTLDDGVLSE